MCGGLEILLEIIILTGNNMKYHFKRDLLISISSLDVIINLLICYCNLSMTRTCMTKTIIRWVLANFSRGKPTPHENILVKVLPILCCLMYSLDMEVHKLYIYIYIYI